MGGADEVSEFTSACGCEAQYAASTAFAAPALPSPSGATSVLQQSFGLGGTETGVLVGNSLEQFQRCGYCLRALSMLVPSQRTQLLLNTGALEMPILLAQRM